MIGARMRQVWWVMAGVSALGVFGTGASGQQMLAAAQTVPVSAVGQASPQTNSNPMAVKVNLNLRNVTLEAALGELRRQAGVEIAFSRATLPVTRKVTVQGSGIALAEAFRQALQGTGTAARFVDGHVVITPVAEATGQGVIVGKVVHAKTKQPVVGATVLLGNAVKGVTTAEDGTFRIPAPAGEQTVHVRMVGFSRGAVKIMVTEDGTISVEVALEPSASVLDEVIVTGTVVATERREISTPITVITADEIERRGITRIEQLFRGEVPSVLALEQGSSVYSSTVLGAMESVKVYTRGASGLGGQETPLKTYVDGVEMLDPSYLGMIDPRSIERIEIISGPQAATVYGSGAMGGVMQIFTKKGRGSGMPEMTFSVKYGILENSLSSGLTPSHSDYLSIAGGTGPEFSYAGTLSYNYTGQWQPFLWSRKTGFSIGVTHRRGRFATSGSVAFTLGRNGTPSEFGRPMAARLRALGEWTGQDGLLASQQLAGSSNQTVSWSSDWSPKPGWQHHFTAGRNQADFEVEPRMPVYMVPADSLFTFRTLSGQRTSFSYNTTMSSAFRYVSSTLTAGITGTVANQTQIYGCLASTSSMSYTPCRNQTIVDVRKSLDDQNWGGFAQWRAGLVDRLYVTLGLRGERNPDYGGEHRVDWTPTNGITYILERYLWTIKFHGSYGRATRPPGPNDKLQLLSDVYPEWEPAQWVGQLANPDLRPEYSSGPQGGIEIYYGNLLAFTVNHYRQYVRDLIRGVIVDTLRLNSVTNPGQETTLFPIQNVNVAAVRQLGWEGTGSVTFGVFAFKGSYAWNDSRISKTYAGAGSLHAMGAMFVGVPTHMGNLTVNFALGGMEFTRFGGHGFRPPARPFAA